MNLDKRIKKNKTYLDCFDIKMAKRFIGKECYIADVISAFRNLNNLTKATLTDVAEYGNDAQPYTLNTMRSTYSAGLILPCEWVEEESKYRPYTIKEFEETLLKNELDGFITFREKDEPDNVYTMRYSGNFISDNIEYVCLGAKNIACASLFRYYEVANNDGEFVPFGIEE